VNDSNVLRQTVSQTEEVPVRMSLTNQALVPLCPVHDHDECLTLKADLIARHTPTSSPTSSPAPSTPSTTGNLPTPNSPHDPDAASTPSPPPPPMGFSIPTTSLCMRLGFGRLDGGVDTDTSCVFTASFTADATSDGSYRITAGNGNRCFLNYTTDDVIDRVLTVDAVIE
jgi:hypothetical protein